MSQGRAPLPVAREGSGTDRQTPCPKPTGGTADPAAIAQHLALLGKDPKAVWLRAFFPVGHRLKATDNGRKAQGVDLRVIASWQADGRGVYLVINDGGNTAASITACRAFWVEWDDRPVEWQRIAWQELELPPPSFMVATGGKSIHCYWVLRTPIPPAEWRPLQARLTAYASGDQKVKDPSRVLRLAGCSYIRADGTSAGLSTIEEPTDNTYYSWEIEACLPPLVEAPERIPLPDPPRAGTEGDLPPRGMEELERLVSSYPTIRADNDQRDEALALVCGLARCMEAIGRSTADAITMATRYHPQAADTFEQVRGWSFEAYSIDSFISRCRDAGVDVSRHDLRRTPPAVNSGGTGAQEPRSRDEVAKNFSELLADALQAVRDRDQNTEMARRAEIMARFRRTDSQVSAALFRLLTEQEAEGKQGQPAARAGVDLSRCDAMEWLVPDHIPAKDQTLIHGAAGSGKTTAAVRLGFCLIEGDSFLGSPPPDRTGSVLYIASDSGIEPLKENLITARLLDHPAVGDGRFAVWGQAAGQGQTTWAATLQGCLELLDAVKHGTYGMVILDSAKAITSKADLNYLDNGTVAALLTFFKEVICRHCAVVWLHHDGTVKASSAGAKAWQEIPSAVHRIEKPPEEDSDLDQFRPRGDRKDERIWRCMKTRKGSEREITFRLDPQTGELITSEGQRNCRQEIMHALTQAAVDGRRGVSRIELMGLARDQWGYAEKTVDKALSRLMDGPRPRVVKLGRGHYGLPEHDRRRAQEASSLNASPIRGGENPETQVREGDLPSLRQTLPCDTSGVSHQPLVSGLPMGGNGGGISDPLPANGSQPNSPSKGRKHIQGSPTYTYDPTRSVLPGDDDPHWGPRSAA